MSHKLWESHIIKQIPATYHIAYNVLNIKLNTHKYCRYEGRASLYNTEELERTVRFNDTIRGLETLLIEDPRKNIYINNIKYLLE